MFKSGSPLLQEIVDEAVREAYWKAWREGLRRAREGNFISLLEARFGSIPRTLKAQLKTLSDRRLKNPVVTAATCPDLASFRERLQRGSRKRRT
jgi:hypothetical protein